MKLVRQYETLNDGRTFQVRERDGVNSAYLALVEGYSPSTLDSSVQWILIVG